jgi:PPP family 3-phenylpropionic acid transporter
MLKKYSILYFLLGITTAAYLPYSVMFLNEIHITPRTIGIIVAFSAIVKIFANPFWGYVTDRIGSVKNVFLICLMTSALLIQLFLIFKSEYIIALLYLLVALFVYSTIPLMDNWILQGIKDKDSNAYGNIRIWPCIAFALSAFFLGKFIQKTSINSIFPIYGLFALITIIFASKVKNNDRAKGKKINIKSVKKIFKDRRYLQFLLFCFLFYIPITGMYTFFPLLMDSLGGTKSQFGLSIFMMSICEVPVYLAGKHLLRKIQPVKIIFFATAFFTCTLLMYSLASEPVHIIIIQSLRGIAQALFMLGFLYYLDQLAPNELKATYMTVAVSVNTGLSGMVGNLLGGWIIELLGIQKMLFIGAVMCFAISGSFLFLVKKPKKQIFNDVV